MPPPLCYPEEMNKYLELGQIVGTHGVKGEMRLNPWCDSADFVKQFKTVYFDANGEKAVAVLKAREHGNVVLITLDGVDSMEKAQALRNTVLYIDRNDVKLSDNSWFIDDLIGCSVVEKENGRVYGKISAVDKYPANDVWTVRTPDGKDVLVPAVKSVVLSVDAENKTAYIKALRGLFDGEESVKENEN
ncbi:MAG: 16S rRNA processing protein RimM [Clostridia bacterium]|nr:16S rRNA processing protein RimM [Clostridia bacterium]